MTLQQIHKSNILDWIQIIEDPRIERHKQYPLVNILVFTLVALMSDQTSWYQIVQFCEENINWFSEFLDTSSGIPSHDTFRRVFMLLDESQIESSLIKWLEKKRSAEGFSKRILALDGKALRGVSWKIDPQQLYLLNAWDSTNSRFQGQFRVGSKTNEITAAPEMLKHFQLKGTVVTMDALLTQKKLAEAIVLKGGDYVMALKGNQGALYEEVKSYFAGEHSEISRDQNVEKSKGRVNIRTCRSSEDIDWIFKKEAWEGLKSIFSIESEVIYEEQARKEVRYYITSLGDTGSDFLEITRRHWDVENQLHRTLDVSFKEDACQIHDRQAASNLSLLRKLALTLLKQIDPKKTLISKLKKAAYAPKFRKQCLMGDF